MKTPPVKDQNRGLLSLTCLVLSLGLLFAGLWPFRFCPVNNVRWIGGKPGLRFDKYGIVSGKEPLFGPGGPVDLALPFTIRMEVRPHEEPSGSLPRILSAYDSDGRELFFLGQWKSELILRILKEERYFRIRTRETGAGGLKKGVTHSIVVRSDSNTLTLFVDGVSASTMSGIDSSPLSDKRKPAWMILGNSPSGESPWSGEFHSLSFYPVALPPGDIESLQTPPVIQYGFSEGGGTVCRGGADPRYDLSIPAVFRAPAKEVLLPPWWIQEYNRSLWKDMLVNILGFIPFGVTMYAWARKSGERKNAIAMGFALLLGTAISLFIELLQAYLPTRDSSLTDVINNVFGTYIGARLFLLARGILYR